jgi:hypothetical protein
MARFKMLLLVALAAASAAALVTRPLARRETAPTLRLRGGMGDISGKASRFT